MILYQLRPIPVPLPTHTAGRRHRRSLARDSVAVSGTEATSCAEVGSAVPRQGGRVFDIGIVIDNVRVTEY